MTYRDAFEKLASAAKRAALNLDKPATVARVNRAMRDAGFPEKLTAGRGYYYWRDGNGCRWTSTYVFRADHQSLREWLNDAALNIQAYDSAR